MYAITLYFLNFYSYIYSYIASVELIPKQSQMRQPYINYYFCSLFR